MNIKLKERIFIELEKVFEEFDVRKDADVFTLINEYQLKRLNNIQAVSNEKQRVSLFRTLNQLDDILIETYKKSKNKNQLLNRLVNSFCLQVPSLKYKDHSPNLSYMFTEIIKNKNKILDDIEWYLRQIPESKWLIEYFINEKGDK